MFRLIVVAFCCHLLVNGLRLEDRLTKLEDEQETCSTCVRRLGELEKEIKSLKEEKSTVSAAFSTRLQEDTTIGDSAVIFGRVDLNIGGGYNEFTGVFTPPVSGIYLLTMYAMTNQEAQGYIYVKRNDQSVCTSYITTGLGFDVSTCTAIVELTEGDSVRVTGHNDYPTVLNENHSGFAGHIIEN